MIDDFPMDREEKREYILEKIEESIEKNGGLIRTAAILDMGIDYRRIDAFLETGELKRVRNGVFTSGRVKYDEDTLVASMFPDGVLTMASALYQYGYISVKPFSYDVAISKNVSKSRFALDYPVVEPYYTEESVLMLGAEDITFGGHAMRIYSRERTICDVLKYEDKLDREVFKKGLLSYINDPDKNVAVLMDIAIKRRVRKKVQDRIGVWL